MQSVTFNLLAREFRVEARARPLIDRRGRWARVAVAAAVVAGSAGLSAANASGGPASGPGYDFGLVPLSQVVPAPVSVQTEPERTFFLNSYSAIYATAGSADATDAANLVGTLLRPPTGYALPVRSLARGADADRDARGIVLALGGADARTNPEGYELTVTPQAITIRANQRAGLFDGVETLRQLLPAKVESPTAVPGPWAVEGGHILDYPRYGYRGAMLDVARHFFPVATVERYIDDIARYKIDYLHLHLADDQGWRIAVDSWPDLATVGGSTGVLGMLSGYYTKADYQTIVAYAKQHGVTVIPEIEGPAHMNAALASYAGLNCDGVAPAPYTGYVQSPNGDLCVHNAETYTFLDQVIGEIAAMTPGPYFGIGGDETQGLSASDVNYYEGRVAAIVHKYGKQVYGWQESLNSPDASSAVGQFWAPGVNDSQVVSAAQSGAKIVMSPATNAYLDMKYTPDEPAFPVGNSWAGYIEVNTAYNWDPATVLPGLPASSIMGVEAPVWTETVFAIDHIEQLAFPRMAAVAEIGWSPASAHDWTSFSHRLAEQGPRLREARVNYYLSPTVPWVWGS